MDHHCSAGSPPLQPESESGGNRDPLSDPRRPSRGVLVQARTRIQPELREDSCTVLGNFGVRPDSILVADFVTLTLHPHWDSPACEVGNWDPPLRVCGSVLHQPQYQLRIKRGNESPRIVEYRDRLEFVLPSGVHILSLCEFYCQRALCRLIPPFGSNPGFLIRGAEGIPKMARLWFAPDAQPANDKRKEEGPDGGSGISGIPGWWRSDGVHYGQNHRKDDKDVAHDERDGPSAGFIRSCKVTPELVVLG